MEKIYQRVIHWFRRDLRITDNTALNRAVETSVEVVPVYVLSSWSGQHHWTGEPRQRFLCGCLESLSRNLSEIGSRLVYRQGDAVSELLTLAKEAGVEAIFTNTDPDPYGRETELRLERDATEQGIKFVRCQDHVLHDADEILTGGGTPYRVFTPYSRNWFTQSKPQPTGRVEDLRTPKEISSLDPPSTAGTWGLASTAVDIPGPGERAARARMKDRLQPQGVISAYASQRNIPSLQGTSRLGQDLRFGLLSIRELFERTELARAAAPDEETAKSIKVYQTELAWREFYMAVLHHFPEVLRWEFNSDWRGLPWRRDDGREDFERWTAGQTGFPIVDAGMRELAATGFMHNRVRMIVSMFLTKDLHIDWRWGEAFFMRSLVDGEIASNNGGWQWSAGTGADAAPYFRIQNPWTQTKSYDPAAIYVKKWVPELQNVEPKRLCAQPKSGERLASAYTEPMVDHKTEREAALAMFKAHRGH